MRRRSLPGAFLLFLLTGCGRYAAFQLPDPSEPERAASPRWEVRPEPVLGRGAAGEWDSVDVLNPAIVPSQGRYFNFYSGFDGKSWHTGLATSTDGISWNKQGRVLSPGELPWEEDYIAANGAALQVDGEFFYWYQTGRPPRIGLARSSDGVHWRRQPSAVMESGPRGSWDERGVADPYVLRANNAFYLFYLGQDRARRQRLGVARSSDGVLWTKLRANPVLELGDSGAFDENGLGEPAVWSARGKYWMLYTGRDRTERRSIGMVSSRDGIRWSRAHPSVVFRGDQRWNSQVVCDPSIEVTSSGVRVWFGGGDAPLPDERLNGQIGLALLRMEPLEGVK